MLFRCERSLSMQRINTLCRHRLTARGASMICPPVYALPRFVSFLSTRNWYLFFSSFRFCLCTMFVEGMRKTLVVQWWCEPRLVRKENNSLLRRVFLMLVVIMQVTDDSEKVDYTAAAFHPDGLILGTGTAQSIVKIWDVKSQVYPP